MPLWFYFQFRIRLLSLTTSRTGCRNTDKRHSWPNGCTWPLWSCFSGGVATHFLSQNSKGRCVQHGRVIMFLVVCNQSHCPVKMFRSFYIEFVNWVSWLTITGTGCENHGQVWLLAKQQLAASLTFVPRAKWARGSRAEVLGGCGLRQASHDAWRCFVHSVPLIVTHEDKIFLNKRGLYNTKTKKSVHFDLWYLLSMFLKWLVPLT